MVIKVLIILILLSLPSIIWLLLREIFSPWWLENIIATPFVILLIYVTLLLIFIHLFTFMNNSIGYLFAALINLFFVILINNHLDDGYWETSFNKTCNSSLVFFQLNIKYTEKEEELNELIEHLAMNHYHLIALQGVSKRIKNMLVKKLTTHYFYVVDGEDERQFVQSDQLLLSRYSFTNIKYIKSEDGVFFISSQWQLPHGEVNLYSLHPPSPRNKKLWHIRNKTIDQLKEALDQSVESNVVVIGDLNISKHSKRIDILKQGMHTTFVNSWPNKFYIPSTFGLAIDHLWVSKSANICNRQLVGKFNWSDHYAIKTQVNF